MKLSVVQCLILFGSVLTVSVALFSHGEELDAQKSSEEYKDDLEIRKRGLSIRGDLRALARMLRFQQNKRLQKMIVPVPAAHGKLIGLGKRNGLNSEENTDDVFDNDAQNENGYLPSSLKKRGRLSINGALQSLSEMLASSGRNRLSEEVSSNKNRLLGLGK